jgi:hypothetical protein
VLARFFYTGKFTASAVLYKSSVQMLMKIKFGHVDTPELKTPDASQAGALGCMWLKLLASKLFLESGFFVTGNEIIFNRLESRFGPRRGEGRGMTADWSRK